MMEHQVAPTKGARKNRKRVGRGDAAGQGSFHNPFKTYYSLVKLETLDKFDAGDRITPELLLERGYLRNLNLPVKVVGDGEISKAVTVVAARFTRSAREKIEAAKGTAEEIPAAVAWAKTGETDG